MQERNFLAFSSTKERVVSLGANFTMNSIICFSFTYITITIYNFHPSQDFITSLIDLIDFNQWEMSQSRQHFNNQTMFTVKCYNV